MHAIAIVSMTLIAIFSGITQPADRIERKPNGTAVLIDDNFTSTREVTISTSLLDFLNVSFVVSLAAICAVGFVLVVAFLQAHSSHGITARRSSWSCMSILLPFLFYSCVVYMLVAVIILGVANSLVW